jgi:CRP-like cAMP-binding protein
VISASERSGRGGPTVLAIDPWASDNRSKGKMHQLLSDEERAHLAIISSVVRFKKGAEIYRSGSAAKAIFNIISGVVSTRSGEDPHRVLAFLFPGDLLGLSAEGHLHQLSKRHYTGYCVPTAAIGVAPAAR